MWGGGRFRETYEERGGHEECLDAVDDLRFFGADVGVVDQGIAVEFGAPHGHV